MSRLLRTVSPASLLLVGTALAGVATWALLPAGVTVLNDDFAFHRSIIETLARGRPWTDDYLAPWAAGLSVLAAGGYLLSRSFQIATQGLLVVSAMLSFHACSRLAWRRGAGPVRAMVIAAALLGFPLVLQTRLEFNSWAVYLPCLLWAVSSAEERRWGRFALAWGLALATRQSAIAWIVLPAAAAWSGWREAEGKRHREPAVVALAGVVWFGFLAATMNRTAAYERLVRPQLLALGGDLLHLEAAARLASRWMVVAVVAMLASALSCGLLHRRQATWSRGAGWRIAVALAGVALLAGLGRVVNVTHYGYRGPLETVYLAALAVLAVGGAAACGVTIDRSLAAMIAVVVAVIGLLAPLQVQYLIEPLVLGFFATRRVDGAGLTVPVSTALRWFWRAAISVAVAGQIAWAGDIKVNFDRQLARVRVAERALRAGRIRESDLPPGVEALIHWRMMPCLAASAGVPGSVRSLLVRTRVPGHDCVFGQRFSRPLADWPGFGDVPVRPGGELLEREVFRCGWFFRGEVTLARVAGGGAPTTAPARADGCEPLDFPLDDAEWRALIRQAMARGLPGG